MITLYAGTSQGLRRASDTIATGVAPDILWIDLFKPTEDEERAIEKAIGLEIPTREEQQEIEISSRIYTEDNAQFMTATLICRAETNQPKTTSVSFILAGGRLITVRYDDPRPFQTFPLQVERHQEGSGSAMEVLVGLLDTIVERAADILERVQADVDALAQEIFAERTDKPGVTNRLYHEALQRIGRNQMLALKTRESLVSIGRVVTFLARPTESKLRKDISQRLKTLERDARSLSDHTTHLQSTIGFMLDAVLGLIQSEQNGIIKIFSVAAVAFLPPTLIASVYGMNFRHMPELHWMLGYPLALVLMVASAVIPLVYFRRRGWL